jgi:hypothetical protein
MRIWQKWKKFALHHEREKASIAVVGDGAIASPVVGHGRLIPVLILDTENRPDIAECIRVHEHLPPGDVNTQWGRISQSNEHVALILSFQRPIELVAIIEFDIVRQGVLVEAILGARATYIQAGRPGDRVKDTLPAPKIIAEIPETGFRPIWDRIFLKEMTRHLRKQGLGRQHAKRAATSAIDELKYLEHVRVPTAPFPSKAGHNSSSN